MKQSNSLTFLQRNKGVLISALKSLLLKLLKLQTMGGFKGWLVGFVVKEFAEEVIEFITVHVEYADIKRRINRTVKNEDRNQATDDLNATMRS